MLNAIQKGTCTTSVATQKIRVRELTFLGYRDIPVQDCSWWGEVRSDIVMTVTEKKR